MSDILSERRAARLANQYQARHGAGLETQHEMDVRAAMRRHPSFIAKHG